MGEKHKTLNKNQITEFIQSLLPIEENFDFKQVGAIFSSEDLGTLVLDKEKFNIYREVLNTIVKDLNTEIISLKAIEKLFQQTILKALDIDKKFAAIPLEKRIKDSIDEFEKSISEKPREVILYFGIEGVEEEGLPFNFGGVEFCIFDSNAHSVFKETVEENWSDGSNKERLMHEVNKMEEWKLYNKPSAKISVSVIDADAAYLTALKILLFTIDVLNFFSDLIPYHNGCYIFLPGECQQTYVEVPMLTGGKKPGVHFKYKMVGPIVNLSFKKLIEANTKSNLGLDKISDLLKKNGNDLEERIISAIKWAGSATAENRKDNKEEAFLKYAISLETLILFDNSKEELSYRLQTRVAQLLSEDYDECKTIMGEIKSLYGIRSKIVHNGEYEVSDVDLALIRVYAKSVVLRLLNDLEFESIDISGLKSWFDRRTFR